MSRVRDKRSNGKVDFAADKPRRYTTGRGGNREESDEQTNKTGPNTAGDNPSDPNGQHGKFQPRNKDKPRRRRADIPVVNGGLPPRYVRRPRRVDVEAVPENPDELDERSGQLVALRRLCDKNSRLIGNIPISEENVMAEQLFWQEAQAFKRLSHCVEHLIGFYSLTLAGVTTSRSLVSSKLQEEKGKISVNKIDRFELVDPYFTKIAGCIDGDQLPPSTLQLVYTILIRLGDLYRYTKDSNSAERLYMAARDLDPSRGHAYNQLALTCPSRPYQAAYYYARAAAATQDPLKLGDTNLKLFIERGQIPILKLLVESSDGGTSGLGRITGLPESEGEWLFLVITAIYLQNVRIILPSLFQSLINMTDKLVDVPHLPEEKVAHLAKFCRQLVSLDVLLQWICDGEYSEIQKRDLISNHTDILKVIKSKLTILWPDLSSPTRSRNTSGLVLSRELFHDWLLRGFEPLEPFFKTLEFDRKPSTEEEMLFSSSLEQMKLVHRILSRLDKLIPKSAGNARKSRNVALGSILGEK